MVALGVACPGRTGLRWGVGLALAVLVVGGWTGCRRPASLSRDYTLVWQEPELPDPVSVRVAIVADNQTHHVFGDPGWLRTGFADKWVREAIRAVQLDLFGQDLLRWVLTSEVDRLPIIHLGDALDLSCRAEFERFTETMGHARKPWFIAPGNHDGYYLGTGYGMDWDNVCRRGGGPFDKKDFVQGILKLLTEQDDPGARALAASPEAGAQEVEWHYEGAERALLRSAAWKIDSEMPWRSYLLQEIDLTAPTSPTPVRAILMDTSQPTEQPLLVTSVGTYPSIREDQLRLVRRWIAQANDEGAVTILMGHHPYHYFPDRLRHQLDQVRDNGSVLLYVSGHDHNGEYIVRGEGEATWLELNIGSVLDWPIEYRTLQLSSGQADSEATAGAPRQLYMRTPRATAWRTWVEIGALDPELPVCQPGWRPQLGDPDFYVSYTAFKAPVPDSVITHLVDVGIESYRRLLTTVKSAPVGNEGLWPAGTSDADVLAETARMLGNSVSLEKKTEWLQKLDTFDRSREAANERLHRDFRLCQALWASQDDSLGARVPQADDWFVVFGKE